MTAWLDADWPAPPGVRALTTLRHGLGSSLAPFDRLNLGLRGGDATATVIDNRRQLGAALALPSPPRWLRQVHGVDVVTEPGDDEPEADAALSRDAGKVLAILTADCLPVVFSAKDGTEIAAAHAGWPGLAAGILERTVAVMQTPPAKLQAWIGPAAGPTHYEIGAEVRERFLSHDGRAASAFVVTRPDHWLVDLFAIARMRLVDAGLAAADIHGGDICTISDLQRFFSHRRSTSDGTGRSGRMATLVWRERTR